MRPPLEPGKHGEISSRKLAPGKHKARVKYRDERGKIREITAQGKTKAESISRLQDRLKNLTIGNAELADTPLKDFAWRWYDEYKDTVATSTAHTTEIVIRTQLEPAGDILLRQITVKWCDDRIRDAGIIRERKNKYGAIIKYGGMSTQRRTRIVLKMILDEAVRLDAIPVNPAQSSRPVPAVKPSPVALSREELHQLRKNVREYYQDLGRARAAFYMPDLVDFLVGTGCRIGEALGVKWDAVDLDAGTVTIRSQVILNPAGDPVFVEHTKTRNDRVLSIPGWLIEVLRSRPRTSEMVFTTHEGFLLRYRRVTGNFAQAKGEGFDGVTPKTIRSSIATLIERELGFQAAGLQLGHEGFENLRSYIVRRGVSDAAGVLEGL